MTLFNKYNVIFVAFSEFLGPTANYPVNVDSKVMDITNLNLENPGRWSFDEAAVSFYFMQAADSNLKINMVFITFHLYHFFKGTYTLPNEKRFLPKVHSI